MENQSLLMIVCRAADSCLKSESHSALATSADVHLNSHSALATLRPSQHSADIHPAPHNLCSVYIGSLGKITNLRAVKLDI